MKTARRTVQLAFVLITLIGVFVVRGNAERWCPFGGVEAIYGYITEGNLICSLGVSNFYVLAVVLLLTLLLRRVFCSYLCPIGALSEWLQLLAKRFGLKPIRVAQLADRILSLLKYALLVVILFYTWRSSELIFRGFDPCYALLGRHGEDITFWSYVVAGAIVVASLFFTIPFCRWLCPLAAVFAPFSKIGLTRVRRDDQTCSDCGVCSRACPMAIPVDRLREVTASRCTSCLECVTICPSKEGQALTWGPPARIGRPWSQAILIAILFAGVGVTVTATYAFPLPSFVKIRGTEPAQTATVSFEINNLNCRGNASLLVYFLHRDDELEIPGYLKLEAWPGPDPARANVIYDPAVTDAQAVRTALSEPYFDLLENYFRPSPFEIVEKHSASTGD